MNHCPPYENKGQVLATEQIPAALRNANMPLFEDVRFGLRTLAKSPGFTAVAITALALGIGVNATVFSLANAVLFKNLPFANSDRVLYIVTHTPGHTNWRGSSIPDFRDIASQVRAFDAVGASTQDSANLTDQSTAPEVFKGAAITPNTFALIGQKPILGRDFTASDAGADAPRAAILSYKVWQNRYGKDPGVIGRVVRLDEQPTTIIGVMSARLDFPREAELWTPLIPEAAAEKRSNRHFTLYGHLAPGANLKQANAEVAGIMQRLAAAYPETNKDFTGGVIDYNEFFAGNESGIKIIFLAMLGAVGFVLLIACANVANMQLARAVGRAREVSIRVALGSGRWRIIRQLLVESVMLSAAGGAIGGLLAIWGIRAFDAAVTHTGKPEALDFSMDVRALLYLAAITIGTGIVFGLAPALRLSRLDIYSALKDGGRGASGSRGKYLSGLLVVAEMALAVVLMAGAGLMIRSFLHAYRSDLGIQSAHVLTMRIDLPPAKYAKPEQQLAFFDRLQAQLNTTPGVEVSAVATDLPLGGWWSYDYEVEGSAPVDEHHRPSVKAIIVSPDYFRALSAPILAGRDFTAADGLPRSPAVMVNREFARRVLGTENPVGQRIRLFEKGLPGAWLPVVAMVPNISQRNNDRKMTGATIYLPFRQPSPTSAAILAKTRVPPASLKETFRRQVQSIDAGLPVYALRTMDEQLEQSNWPYRVFGILFSIFAGIALLLASVGLYAVIAHSVSQRTQEIGVRMALGATSAHVLWLVFAQGLTQAAIGMALGIPAALAVTGVLKSLLVDVSPTDPATFATVAIVLSAAAILGCLIPARRALRVDPVEALRHE